MNGISRRGLLAALIGGVTLTNLSLPPSALASGDWPQRPVTVVVGFSAGGPTDIAARVLADGLSQYFKQSFVVDNKAGAAGGVAAMQVSKAAPDGYTLMIGSSSTLSIIPALQKTGYDPLKDFTAIGLVASYPYFLMTAEASDIRSVDDLVARGRADGPGLNYGSAGTGAVNHLAGEWFSREVAIKAQHVPYKGDSAVISDLVAGRLDFAFIAGSVALPQLKGGKMRLLASAGAEPGRGAAGVETLGATRIKGFAAEPWNGLMGPAGLPRPIVDKLNAAINDVMHRPDVVARLAAIEQFPLTGSPEDFTSRILSQGQRWGEVIKAANITME